MTEPAVAGLPEVMVMPVSGLGAPRRLYNGPMNVCDGHKGPWLLFLTTVPSRLKMYLPFCDSSFEAISMMSIDNGSKDYCAHYHGLFTGCDACNA